MAEIANALGVGPTFTFEGVTYRVGVRDFQVEAEMERHLEAVDLRTIRRHEKDLGPAETQRQLADWRRACSSKTWSYGMPDFVRYYFMTSEGMRKQAYLQLARHNPHMTEDVIDRVEKDSAAWQDMWDRIAQANADPLASGGTPAATPPATMTP